MPIFVYECKFCEVEAEEIQPKPEPFPRCKWCGRDMEHVLFPGGTGFSLKGRGWGSDGYSDTNWERHTSRVRGGHPR